jgi:excisionase family DNA binding protein
MPSDYLTSAQAAKILGVTTTTVRQWVQQGYLVPAHKTQGGHCRFRLMDVASKVKYPCDECHGAEATHLVDDHGRCGE